MNLIQFLEDKRQGYIKAVELTFDKINLDNNLEPFLEPIDKKNNQSEESMFSLFRYDILVKNSDGYFYNVIVNVNPEIFEKPEIFFEIDIELNIKSFVWNACKINVENFELISDFINEWYIKEIKIEQQQVDKKFINAIHSIDLMEDNNVLIIDFGSIAANRIVDFFHLLSTKGIRSVTITSGYI